jgi:hypothetical protein
METQTPVPIKKRRIFKVTILYNIIMFFEGEVLVGKYVGGKNIFTSKN